MDSSTSSSSRVVVGESSSSGDGGCTTTRTTAAALMAAGNDEKDAATASLELAAALHQTMNEGTNTATSTTTTTAAAASPTDNILTHVVVGHLLPSPQPTTDPPPGLSPVLDNNDLHNATTAAAPPTSSTTTGILSSSIPSPAAGSPSPHPAASPTIVEVASTPGALGLPVQSPPPPSSSAAVVATTTTTGHHNNTNATTTTTRTMMHSTQGGDDDLVSTRLELYESRKTLERLMFENSELQRLIEQLEVEVHNQRQLNSNGMRGFAGGGLIPKMQQDKRLHEDLRDLQEEFDRVQEEKGEMKKVYSEQIQQLTQLLSYAAVKLQQQQEQQQQQQLPSPTPPTLMHHNSAPVTDDTATSAAAGMGVQPHPHASVVAGDTSHLSNAMDDGTADTGLGMKVVGDSRKDALEGQLLAQADEIKTLTKHYKDANAKCSLYQQRLEQYEYDINRIVMLITTKDDTTTDNSSENNEVMNMIIPSPSSDDNMDGGGRRSMMINDEVIRKVEALQEHRRNRMEREAERVSKLEDENKKLKVQLEDMRNAETDGHSNGHHEGRDDDDDDDESDKNGQPGAATSSSMDLQTTREKLALAEDRIQLLEQYIKQQSIKQQQQKDNDTPDGESDNSNNNDGGDDDDSGIVSSSSMNDMSSLKQCIAATTTELHSTKEMLVKSERRYRCLLDACRDVQTSVESEYPQLMPILSPVLHQQASASSWSSYASMTDDTYGSARGQQQQHQRQSAASLPIDIKHTRSPSINRLNALKKSLALSFAHCERRILALEDKIDVPTTTDGVQQQQPPPASSLNEQLPEMIRRWVSDDVQEIYHMFAILPGLVRSLLDISTEACIDNAKLLSITTTTTTRGGSGKSGGDNDGNNDDDADLEEITMLKEHITSLKDRLTDLTQLNAFSSEMRSRTSSSSYRGYLMHRSRNNNNTKRNYNNTTNRSSSSPIGDDDASSSSSSSLDDYDPVMLEREEVLKQCQRKAVEGGERIEDQLVDALRQVIYVQRNGEEIDRRSKLVIRNLNERINHLETVIVAMRVKQCQQQQQQQQQQAGGGVKERAYNNNNTRRRRRNKKVMML
ncbi:hypothetical protein FOZ60_007160 [Perkinsus olseni]|uniref:Uncharacterized protein n=2 Tax=Perkinsus olseni TaxID=32597 RepID=A0A7J6NMJ2_PEROL|nr:hypothetical protein FOZ60_007160 [Perkinsus olseni]